MELGARLRAFTAFVRRRSFAGAAEELRISQPAVSQHIAGLERQLGITPEVKRYNEIKAGVIVSCVGVAVSIFLFFLMNAIAYQNPQNGELLRSVWLAGLIPFMVGIALIINGVVVSKKMVEVIEREQNKTKSLEEGAAPRGLKSPDTNEFVPVNFSVTDQTTRHLENAERKVNR